MTVPEIVSRMGEPAGFDGRPVDQGTIMSILEAARLAPSANNSQVWRFFIIRDDENLRQAVALAARPVFAGARTIIAACADPWIIATRGTEQPFFMIDVPIALAHVSLMAREAGVSVSIAFEFDEKRLLSLIAAPRRYRAVALVALGYAEQERPRPGEASGEIVRII